MISRDVFSKNLKFTSFIEFLIIPFLTVLFVLLIGRISAEDRDYYLGFQLYQVVGPFLSLNLVPNILNEIKGYLILSNLIIFVNFVFILFLLCNHDALYSILVFTFILSGELNNIQIVYNRIHTKLVQFYYFQLFIRFVDLIILYFFGVYLWLMWFIIIRLFSFFYFDFIKLKFKINRRIAVKSIFITNWSLLYYVLTLPVFYAERFFGYKVELHYFNFLVSFIHAMLSKVYEFFKIDLVLCISARLSIVLLLSLSILFKCYTDYAVLFFYIFSLPYYYRNLSAGNYSFLLFSAGFSLVFSLPFIFINLFYFKPIFILSQLLILFFGKQR